MNIGIPYIRSLANPRLLAGMVLLFGLASVQGGRGTLAYFTSTAVSADNIFTAGKIDVSTSALSSGTGATFTFSTGTATTADCDLSGNSLNSATFTNTQFTPGVYCTGKLTIANSGSTADAWLRMRLVRKSGSTTGVDQALNDKLKLYVREIPTASLGGASSCAKATFNPTSAATTYNAVNLATGVPLDGVTFATLGLTANSTNSTAEASMVAGSYVNLIGSDTVDSARETGAASATLTNAVNREFCVMVYFPSTTTAGTLQTTTDNAAQGGTDTYAVHMLAAQKSGRPSAAAVTFNAAQTFTGSTGGSLNISGTGFQASGTATITAISQANGKVYSIGTEATNGTGAFTNATHAVTAGLLTAGTYSLNVTDGTTTINATNSFTVS